MVSLKEVKIPKGVKASIKDIKDLKSEDFFKLSQDSQVKILNDGIDKFRTYIDTRRLTPELSDYMKLFEDIYRETGDPNVTPYLQLFDAMKSRDGSKLSRDVLETLRKDDPDTLALYLNRPGEEVANIPGFDFYDYRRTGNGIIESAEPTTGALTNTPLNSASSAESAPGALTNPPSPSELPKTKTTIREPISDEDMIKLTYPKEGIVVGPETSKPGVDIPLAEENPAAAASPSPSPEAIGEAMRGAIKDRVGDTQLNKEDIPAFLTKEGEVKAAEAVAKESETKAPAAGETLKAEAEAKTEAAIDKTDSKAPETPETPQGLFSRIGGHIGRNWRKYLGGLGLGGIGWAVMDDLASDNSTLKSLFREGHSPLDANNPSANQPRNEPATNEEYVPGKIPSHIPQDNLAPIKESTTSKKIKNQPQQQKQQPQVIIAPENNATADYVRAAYNSYIPSDAGRAYQKAIYGDPLELERNRQQQKWRDFVMRSGQSPAELVQRGLMPYDALQYV